MKLLDHCLWLCCMAQKTWFFPRTISCKFEGKSKFLLPLKLLALPVPTLSWNRPYKETSFHSTSRVGCKHSDEPLEDRVAPIKEPNQPQGLMSGSVCCSMQPEVQCKRHGGIQHISSSHYSPELKEVQIQTNVAWIVVTSSLNHKFWLS